MNGILGNSIFVPGFNNYCGKGALNVVDFTILS